MDCVASCANNNDSDIQFAGTVRKLRLDIDFQELNLRSLQGKFPNLSKLHFAVSERGIDGRDSAMLHRVWECWPYLEELALEFFGVHQHSEPGPWRNFEIVFHGIFEEEAKLLAVSG